MINLNSFDSKIFDTSKLDEGICMTKKLKAIDTDKLEES